MSDISLPQGEPMVDEPIQKNAKPPAELTKSDLENAPKERSNFGLAMDHRRMFYDRLKDGTSPFLPNEKGELDITPAVNAVNQTSYKGPNVLILKSHQKTFGYPTPEYAAYTQIEQAARNAGFQDRFIKESANPVIITVLDNENMQNGKPTVKPIKLFNIADAAHPETIAPYAQQKAVEKEQSFMKWQETKAAQDKNFEIRPYYKPNSRTTPGPAFKISTANPSEYVAQALAAQTLHSPSCKVDPKVADTFKQNVIDQLYAKSQGTDGKSYTNPYNLYTLGGEASTKCREILHTIYKRPEQENEQPQQKKQQPTQAKEQPSLSM
jgi:hypothetical protein